MDVATRSPMDWAALRPLGRRSDAMGAPKYPPAYLSHKDLCLVNSLKYRVYGI